jgi:hypothetical protein
VHLGLALVFHVFLLVLHIVWHHLSTRHGRTGLQEVITADLSHRPQASALACFGRTCFFVGLVCDCVLTKLAAAVVTMCRGFWMTCMFHHFE